MKKKKVNWRWEDTESQKSFADYVGFPGPEDTSRELDDIERLASVHPPMKVLDLGCGTGRHTIEMARRGYSSERILQHYYPGTRLERAWSR